MKKNVVNNILGKNWKYNQAGYIKNEEEDSQYIDSLNLDVYLERHPEEKKSYGR